MTKAEELKVLAKIDALIKSAGDDSYIAMTFKGVVEIARSNIENDFGDAPVEDLETMRKNFHKMDEIAKSAFADLDNLKSDFDKLEAAYREAVQVVQESMQYLHDSYNSRASKLDSLKEDDTDGDIAEAYREALRVKSTYRKGSEVLNAAYVLLD